MANETLVPIRGRLTADPELRFISSGSPVVNFTIAHNGRKFNKSTNEWEDTETTFYPCSAWGHLAENIAESLRKGMPVLAYGELYSRSWEQNGEKRSRMEVKVQDIGPSLALVKVDANTIQRSTGQGGGGQTQAQGGTPAPAGPSTGNGGDTDPWASAPASEEPPF